jgi:hypothetical protein
MLLKYIPFDRRTEIRAKVSAVGRTGLLRFGLASTAGGAGLRRKKMLMSH